MLDQVIHDTDLLDLPNWHVVRVDKGDHYTILVARENPVFPVCCSTQDLRKNGTKLISVRDMPMHGKFVDIQMKRQQYDCRSCKKSGMYEDVSQHVDIKRNMTRRLVLYVGQQSVRRTFSGISTEVGVSESTVRRIFDDYSNAYMDTRKVVAPRILGIDDKQIGEEWLTVLGDIENKKIIEIVKYRDKKSVIAFIAGMAGRWDIQVVCQDMSKTYKAVTEIALPWATMVVDKYHVVALANNAVDAARVAATREYADKEAKTYAERRAAQELFVLEPEFPKIVSYLSQNRKMFLALDGTLGPQLRARVKKWLEVLPDLKRAYEIKESFYTFYMLETREEAKQYYRDWLASITEKKQLDHFKYLLSAMRNHEEQILNYFDYPVTSGFIEGLNRSIASVDQTGRGYGFEVMRKKVLMTYNETRRKKVAFRRTRNLAKGLRGASFDDVATTDQPHKR